MCNYNSLRNRLSLRAATFQLNPGKKNGTIWRATFQKVRRIAGGALAVAGLSLATLTGNVLAQCDSGVGCSLGLNIPVGQPVHIGDVITITAVTVFNGPTTCATTNVRVWVVYPDGLANLAEQDLTLPAGPV